MIYLTYNDPPSGIYSSQVIDVCKFLNQNFNVNVRLISLISTRGFAENRRKIKKEFPSAIVLPMFPGVANWSMNVLWLHFVVIFVKWGWNIFYGFSRMVAGDRAAVIARGPFAAALARSLKRRNIAGRICFDARGAYDAEFNEYKVAGESKLNKEIFSLEKRAVLDSDFRLAVSNALVNYWKNRFGYNSTEHVVIPCTVNSVHLNAVPVDRASLGFSKEDVIFVYSGSSAGWQSLKLADDFLSGQMKINPKAKALFLTDKLPDNMTNLKDFKERVVVKWIDNDKMASVLAACDYGLLIREKSVTNQVSSPVKFAEYLAAGLSVVISDTIEDYSEFVKQYGCGIIPGAANTLLSPLAPVVRQKNKELALTYLSKESFKGEYRKVIESLVR